jgi:hypothetical protein
MKQNKKLQQEFKKLTTELYAKAQPVLAKGMKAEGEDFEPLLDIEEKIGNLFALHHQDSTLGFLLQGFHHDSNGDDTAINELFENLIDYATYCIKLPIESNLVKLNKSKNVFDTAFYVLPTLDYPVMLFTIFVYNYLYKFYKLPAAYIDALLQDGTNPDTHIGKVALAFRNTNDNNIDSQKLANADFEYAKEYKVFYDYYNFTQKQLLATVKKQPLQYILCNSINLNYDDNGICTLFHQFYDNGKFCNYQAEMPLVDLYTSLSLPENFGVADLILGTIATRKQSFDNHNGNLDSFDIKKHYGRGILILTKDLLPF